jgi:hypothetical protein
VLWLKIFFWREVELDRQCSITFGLLGKTKESCGQVFEVGAYLGIGLYFRFGKEFERLRLYPPQGGNAVTSKTFRYSRS